MEVEARREVDRQRNPVREAWRRPGEPDLAEVRLDRQLEADETAELGGPDAGCTHNRPRIDRAECGLDPDDGSVRRLDARDRAAGENRGPVRTCSRRVPLSDRLRARVAVEGAERRSEHTLEARD